MLRGLRVTGYYVADDYVKGAERTRAVGQVTFEHKYLNASAEYLDAKDQPLKISPEVTGRGYTLWATPRVRSWEGLVRRDHLKPNTVIDGQVRTRTVAGGSYWFPMKGNVTTALLLDFDRATFANAVPARPRENKVALHMLLNF